MSVLNTGFRHLMVEQFQEQAIAEGSTFFMKLLLPLMVSRNNAAERRSVMKLWAAS